MLYLNSSNLLGPASQAQVDKNYTPENWKTWIVSLDGSSQLDVSGFTGLGQMPWRP
jgi:hypothetical protein